jgi:hypothetical protein
MKRNHTADWHFERPGMYLMPPPGKLPSTFISIYARASTPSPAPVWPWRLLASGTPIDNEHQFLCVR